MNNKKSMIRLENIQINEKEKKRRLDLKKEMDDDDIFLKNLIEKAKIRKNTGSKINHEVDLPKEKPKKENFKAYVEKFLSFPKDDLHEALEYFHSKPIKTYQNRFWEAFGDPTTLFFKYKRGVAEINVGPSKIGRAHV